MKNRFKRLFALEQNLYTVGSPIIVVAGALLQDTENNELLAQLKFKNINNKIVKAVEVEITCMDIANRTIEKKNTYKYLDLNADRNAEFGSKVPIPLSDDSTRSFEVRILEVVTEDNDIWDGNGITLNPIPESTELPYKEKVLREYKIKYGSQSKYIFTKYQDLWICTCGATNHLNEIVCCECKNSFKELENLDEEKIVADAKQRQIDETREREEKELEKKNRLEIKKEKDVANHKKWGKTAIALAILLGIIYGGTVFYQNKQTEKMIAQVVNECEDGIYTTDNIKILIEYDVEGYQEIIQNMMLSYIESIETEYIPTAIQLVDSADEYIWTYQTKTLNDSYSYISEGPGSRSELDELYTTLSTFYDNFTLLFESDIVDELSDSLQEVHEKFIAYAEYMNETYTSDDIYNVWLEHYNICNTIRALSDYGDAIVYGNTGYYSVEEVGYIPYETGVDSYCLELQEAIYDLEY